MRKTYGYRPRIKAYSPKTRTGCLTCKARRVKCDEGKPSCQRCIQGDRRCGYAPPKTWLFEVNGEKETLSVQRWCGSLSRDPRDERAFTFFLEKTVQSLAVVAPLAHELFSLFVPQIARSDPIICHMLIATASLQEELQANVQQPPDALVKHPRSMFFLYHHQKAIQLLTRLDKPPSVEIVLMSCLLFIACEHFQGSTINALSHVSSGLEILKEWKATHASGTLRDSTKWYIMMKLLDPLFGLQSEQTLIYRAASSGHRAPRSTRLIPKPTIGASFESIADARNSFDRVIQYVFRPLWSQSHEASGITSFESGKRLLQEWYDAFRTFCTASPTKGISESVQVSMLTIHHETISRRMDQAVLMSEMAWDRYNNEMGQNVSVIENILEYEDRQMSTNSVAQSLRNKDDGEDLGFIAPLFNIACHCREPVLRRRVILLLRRLQRIEGSWNSCTAAQIAVGVMKIEERGISPVLTSEDIPEQQRVRLYDAHLANTGKVILSFGRMPYLELEEEELDWSKWSKEPPALIPWSLAGLIQQAGYQGVVRSHPLYLCPNEKVW